MISEAERSRVTDDMFNAWNTAFVKEMELAKPKVVITGRTGKQQFSKGIAKGVKEDTNTSEEDKEVDYAALRKLKLSETPDEEEEEETGLKFDDEED